MSKDKREGYYATLKQGDVVLVYGRIGQIGEVSGITPTGRIKVGHSTFDHTGRVIGGSRWERLSIEDLSTTHGQKLLEKTKKRHTLAAIRKIVGEDWGGDECKVPLEVLQGVLKTLKGAFKETE